MKKVLSLLVALFLCVAVLPAMATEDAPQRIVSLPVWATEILMELVGPERLIGISAYCDNPAVTYIAGDSAGLDATDDGDGSAEIHAEGEGATVSITGGADGSAEIHVEVEGVPEDIEGALEKLAGAFAAEDAAAIGIIGGADGPTEIFVTGGMPSTGITDDYVVGGAAQVPNRVASNNAEGILALAPDLVVMDTFSDWDGSLAQTLKDAGIRVLLLESPTDFETIMYRITDLGEAVQEPEQADTMVEELSDRLNDIAKQLQGLTDAERTRVMYYEDMYDATGNSAGLLCAYGPGSTFDAIAAAAGCINVCTAENYSPVSKETLLVDWQPGMLIVSSSYMDENYVQHADGGEQLISAILADDTLQELPAVKDGQVYAIDDRARSSTAQYMVLAVEELARLAYPDRFE